MISIIDRAGSGFDLIRKYKGSFRIQDAMQYYGIYDNAIFTNSGRVCIGFYVDFDEFKKDSGFLEFIHRMDNSIETVFQIYLIKSKSTVLLYFFITFPYPYRIEKSFLKGIIHTLSMKSSYETSSAIYSKLNNVRADVIEALPGATVLTDTGLNSFLNLLINKNLSNVRDISRHIYDDIHVHYGYYSYQEINTLVLKMKNFPEEDVLPDLIYGSPFDFPFIMQFTITKPPKTVSNEIFFKEGDYAEQVRRIFQANSTPKTESGNSFFGDDIMLTQSFGDYVYHFDLAVHLFHKDANQLVDNASHFQSHMRDFNVIFAHEQLELINSIASFFPGLSFLYQDKFDILNPDLKFLLPWKKDIFKTLIKEKDRYPEFKASSPPSMDEAVFQPIKLKQQVGERSALDLPDEETMAKVKKDISVSKPDIGTKKNIIEDEAIEIESLETVELIPSEQPKTIKIMDEMVNLDLVTEL